MAQERRLFLPAIPATHATPHAAAHPTSAASWALDAEEAHYAGSVLRLGDGDAVRALNGAGGVAPATLHWQQSGRTRAASLQLQGPFVPHASLVGRAELTVVVPLPKGERADWMVEKLAELACAAVVIVHTARSVDAGHVQQAGKRLERLGRVARAAARQARHGRVPRLTDGAAVPLAALFAGAAVGAAPDAGAGGGGGAERGARAVHLPQGRHVRRWVADLGDALPSLAEALTGGKAGRAGGAGDADDEGQVPVPLHHVVLLGPEGGLTEDELNQARAFGYTPVGLGPHVLRVETAAIAAAAAVNQA